MYARNQPPVYLGVLSAGTVYPFVHVGKLPVRVRDVEICFDTDVDPNVTYYYDIRVVKIDKVGNVFWESRRLTLDTLGLRAYTWHVLLEDAGVLSNTTLGLRVVRTGSTSGLTVGYSTEERLDER